MRVLESEKEKESGLGLGLGTFSIPIVHRLILSFTPWHTLTQAPVHAVALVDAGAEF